MRFLRFAIAGSGGCAVQIGAVAALLGLGVNYLLATAIAVEAAILTNFVGHHYWTWNDRRAERRHGFAALERLLRFNAVTGVTSIFGSIFITAIGVELLGLHAVVANLASVMTLSVVNFISSDRLVFRAGVVVLGLGLASGADANDEATLQPRTSRDFARYAAAVEARSARSLANHEPFLDWERRSPAEQARLLDVLRRGGVLIERAPAARDNANREITIEAGTINHWRGTVFIPGVKLDHVLKVLKAPQTDLHKQEDVLSSRVVARGSDDAQKVFLRLKRTKFITVVYDTEYDVHYQRLGPDRAVSHSVSTRIVEIENAGTARERARPEGNDAGYLWRLNSYWRYKQLGDGVVVEVESLTLSRDLPPVVGPLIRPIVNSTARESIERTLRSMRARFLGATM